MLKRIVAVVLVMLGVVALVGATMIKPIVYEQSPWPFGYGSVYSHEEFPDPVAQLLAIVSLVCFTLAGLMYLKSIGRALGHFLDSIPVDRSSCCAAPLTGAGVCYRCGRDTQEELAASKK